VAPLVLVHGFTQNQKCWGSIAEALREHHQVITVDAPGHGTASGVRADLWQTADLLAEAATGTFLGYSMGARMVLHVALAHPERVERIVLVSGTPGIVDAGERAARVQRDEALAQSLERDGLDEFLARWLAQPLFSTLPASAHDDKARRENTVEGLASSLRLAGTGTQEPLWDRLSSLDVPVLLVAGALDERFTTTARQMAELVPHATLRVMPDRGHACHREDEAAFIEILDDWLVQGT